MCFGYKSSPKRLITNAKISCPTFDIHTSKLAVAKWHSIKVGKTYNYVFISTNLGNNPLNFIFSKEKQFLNINAYQMFLTNYFLQIVKEDVFLQLQKSNLS
jgi:hypothetical protein